MQTKPTGSPVPGVIPEPVRAHDDAAAGSKPSGVTSEVGSPHRGPLAKLMSRLRGDKYMVDAYPPGQDR